MNYGRKDFLRSLRFQNLCFEDDKTTYIQFIQNSCNHPHVVPDLLLSSSKRNLSFPFTVLLNDLEYGAWVIWTTFMIHLECVFFILEHGSVIVIHFLWKTYWIRSPFCVLKGCFLVNYSSNCPLTQTYLFLCLKQVPESTAMRAGSVSTVSNNTTVSIRRTSLVVHNVIATLSGSFPSHLGTAGT